ncbi:hypothetical protein RFI_10234 [Reticulomyxa filosa]|uniref:RGS domain-containing protein n=1 Tax=Reticulomyxa filosa TaxID=46433 RepID=X6NMJ8_RETFI|nr:hypothetical protein RFI_10234 [Reticulomyxa filosa]|eukprot:ETO26899.1 hypothetical protein RFI_10234 [Reticulomyxa filosa]
MSKKKVSILHLIKHWQINGKIGIDAVGLYVYEKAFEIVLLLVFSIFHILEQMAFDPVTKLCVFVGTLALLYSGAGISKREYILQFSVNVCLLLAMCVVHPFGLVGEYLRDIKQNGTTVCIAVSNVMWFTIIECVFKDKKKGGGGIRSNKKIKIKIAYFGAIILFPLRVYFLYYNLHHNVAISQGRWVHSLNKSALVMSDSLKWFIRTSVRRTYGNVRWVYTRFVVPIFVVEYMLYLILQFTGQLDLERIVNNASFLLLAVVVLYYWSKTPNYADYIYLKLELQYLLGGTCMLIVMYIGYSLALAFDPSFRYFTRFEYLAFVCVPIGAGCTVIIVFSTYGVLKLNDLWSFLSSLDRAELVKADSDDGAAHRNSGRQHSPRNPGSAPPRMSWNTHAELRQVVQLRYAVHRNNKQMSTVSTSSSNRQNNTRDSSKLLSFIRSYGHSLDSTGLMQLHLRDILAHEHHLQVFMDFLIGEFSQENLLVIIEVTQFKDKVRGSLKHETKEDVADDDEAALHLVAMDAMDDNAAKGQIGVLKRGKDLQISLPEKMVQSEIVSSGNLTIEQKFEKLVEKYILLNSPFCINISDHQRANLLTQYALCKARQNSQNGVVQEEMTLDKYLTVFDECLREIICLIKDSFGRFIYTDMYHKLCEQV